MLVRKLVESSMKNRNKKNNYNLNLATTLIFKGFRLDLFVVGEERALQFLHKN